MNHTDTVRGNVTGMSFLDLSSFSVISMHTLALWVVSVDVNRALNMSDHLPLVAELTAEYPVQTQPDTWTNHYPWLDLEQATKSGEINEYCQLMKQQLSELTSHACLEGLEDIEAAISEYLGRSLFKSSPISDNPDLVELKVWKHWPQFQWKMRNIS